MIAPAPDLAHRQRLLVADDDVAVGRTARRYLQGPYDVEVVHDGPAAVEAYFRLSPDLVLLDFSMPGMTGVGVIQELRRRVDSRLLAPVIIMSGTADERVIGDCLVAGANDFLMKPFVSESLLAKVASQLAARQLALEALAQRERLIALEERREREAAAAAAVLERMISRGEFDAARTRRVVMTADTFGGDFVFGATTPSGAYRWMLGDVTGHTLSSALVTIPISMIFYATTARDVRLPDVITTLDTELARLLPIGMFCAAAVCELDRAAGRLTVWNGGVPDVLVQRAGGGAPERVASGSVPLGADRRGGSAPEITTVPVGPGDRVYAFSDGLVEARDARGAMLGVDRLAALVGAAGDASAFDRLLAALDVHAGGVREDDVSLIEVVA